MLFRQSQIGLNRALQSIFPPFPAHVLEVAVSQDGEEAFLDLPHYLGEVSLTWPGQYSRSPAKKSWMLLVALTVTVVKLCSLACLSALLSPSHPVY